MNMNSHAKILFVFFGVLLTVLVACGASSQHSLEPLQVAGIAMEPALKKGDRILITKDVGDLKRGDIVAYYYPGDPSQLFISRIIGLPHEEIEIRNGKVFVDGKLLEEAYVKSDNNRASFDRRPMTVPDGRLFVMGDNRDNSTPGSKLAFAKASMVLVCGSRYGLQIWDFENSQIVRSVNLKSVTALTLSPDDN